jgi:RsiW-degrading membrane proteinase PrsW (M82 family)
LSLASFVVALIQNSLQPLGTTMGSNVSSYLFAAGLGGIGLLLIPSAVDAGRHLFGQPPPIQIHWRKVAWITPVAPLLLLLGYGIQIGPGWTKIFFPLIHVLANAAVVFWLLGFVRRKIPDQGVSRFWGSFASGLGFTPLLAFFLEVLILVGIALIWIGLSDLMPGFNQALLDLVVLVRSPSDDPQDLQRALEVFAAQRGVLFTLFSYVALLIPVVEELLKPAAVWLLRRRYLEPWEGFVLGATSGAGYALFENLTIGAAAEIWTFITLTRLGTAAVHMFTAGMMGWGLASTFKEKKLRRIISAFVGAVAVHGIWNGLNILAAISELGPVQDRLGLFGTGFSTYIPVALATLALGCFLGLIKANRFFRRAIMAGSDKQSEAAWKL